MCGNDRSHGQPKRLASATERKELLSSSMGHRVWIGWGFRGRGRNSVLDILCLRCFINSRCLLSFGLWGLCWRTELKERGLEWLEFSIAAPPDRGSILLHCDFRGSPL